MGHKKLKSETIIMDHDHVLEGASRLMERRKGSSAPSSSAATSSAPTSSAPTSSAPTSPAEYDPFDPTDSSSANALTAEIIISVVIRHLSSTWCSGSTSRLEIKWQGEPAFGNGVTQSFYTQAAMDLQRTEQFKVLCIALL